MVRTGSPRGGRPLLVPTSEQADQIARFVRGGTWPGVAAQSVSIADRTFDRWMQRGRKAEEAREDDEEVTGPEEPFWRFWRTIERAAAECEIILVTNLQKAASTSPTAALALLERRFPDRWRPKQQIEMKETGQRHGPPLVINLIPSDRPQEEIDAFMAEIEPRSGSPSRAEEGDGAPARQAATPPRSEPDEDDEDPDTWRDPISGRLLNDLDAEAEERARIHRGAVVSRTRMVGDGSIVATEER